MLNLTLTFLPAQKSMFIITHLSITVNTLIEHPGLLIADYVVQSFIGSEIENAICPNCHMGMGFVFFKTYERQLFNEKINDYVYIQIPVFKCSNPDCSHPYHAVLPSVISPYKSFSYDDIFAICEGYQTATNKEDYAKQFNITSRTIRKWISILKAQNNLIQHSLNSLFEYTWVSLRTFIQDLQSSKGKVSLQRFLSAFLRNNRIVFHQNIATRTWPIQYDPG